MNCESCTKYIDILKAFERWWRFPSSHRTIDTIEPAMIMCLEALEMTNNKAPNTCGNCFFGDSESYDYPCYECHNFNKWRKDK